MRLGGEIFDDRRGVTIVEFGLVAPVLALMLMGLFDLMHHGYVSSVLHGALQDAGRKSTLEGGALSIDAVNAAVEDTVDKIVPNATYFPERLNYRDFANVSRPEDYTDANNNNRYDVGECFEDVNNNGRWDEDMGRIGQGGANDVVAYSITVRFPRLFPMAGLIGWSPDQEVKATTILRNQPYGDQAPTTHVECS